jgi:hypothetical protein
MRFFAVFGLACGLALAAPVHADVTWVQGGWPQALAAARATQKPIMALFFRPGCGPCIMQDTTLAAPEVAAYAGTFVNVRFDVDDPIGKEMARRLKVIGSPHTLFFDARGEEQDRLVGSKLSDRGDPRAHEYLNRVIALDSTNTLGRADDALMAWASLARRDSSYAEAAATLEQLLSRFPDSNVGDRAFRTLASTYQSIGRTDRAVTTLERWVAAKPDDPRRLNDLAWSLTQWKGDLDKALAAANKAVQLGPENPGYLDTLAEVHFARREFALAVATGKRALEKAPLDHELEAQMARFEAAERAAKPGKQ